MDDKRYEKAKKRVEELKGFYTHLAVYIVLITFFAVVNFLTNPSFWWFLFIAFFSGNRSCNSCFVNFLKTRLVFLKIGKIVK